MCVVVISGPIASGKSTLGRAVAARLGEDGRDGAIIDLDLVYEILDPKRRPKTDAAIWSAARRATGRMAAGFHAEGRAVVVEGDFASDRALDELLGQLPSSAVVRVVLLEASFTTAFERALADPTRGVSKDEAFLAAHYQQFDIGWNGRDVLRVNTDHVGVDESADCVIGWIAQ